MNPNQLAPVPADRYIPQGLIAQTAVQCVHPESGLTGSWLFGGGNHKEKGAAVSPLFADCFDLFTWANANGWQSVPGTYAHRKN